MSDTSPILALPLIQPAQAQKHVTHNEALRLLDVLVQAAALTRGANTPPPTPAAGDRHITGAAPTGAWAGQPGRIAVWEDPSGWFFLTPAEGWTVHVVAEDAAVTFIDGQWVAMADRALRVAQLGIGTDADTTNRLAVVSPATLLTHAGAGHQVKVNKAAAGDTASLLFQTNFSGRAEMGTTQTDDFSVKVSSDGLLFRDGLSVAAATGVVSLPQGVRVADGAAATPGLGFAADTDTGLVRPGADQIGLVTGGTQRLLLSTSALTPTVPLLAPNGTAALPSLSFSGDTNTGMLSAGADQIGWATGGTQRLLLSTSALTPTVPLLAPNGTAALPSLSFSGDTNTGMLSAGADQIGWATGGTQRLLLSTSALTPTVPVLASSGSAAAPSLSFSGDTNTGLFSLGADVIGFATNGAERMRVGNNGLQIGDPVANGVFGVLRVAALSSGGAATVHVSAYGADAGGPALRMGKSRSATLGGSDIVQTNDVLGSVNFLGSDGTTINNLGADIVSVVVGTPALGDIRANLRLRTRGAGGVADRLVLDDTGAAVTGRLAVNGCAGWATTVIIADDAVATVTPGRTGGFLAMTCGGQSGAASTNEALSAHIFFDCGSTAPAISKGTGFASIGANVAVVTTDLTGTSGTDGNVTVSARNDGTLKIENRSGASATFNLWVM